MKPSEIKKQLTDNSRLVINNGKEQRVVELNLALDGVKNVVRRSILIDEAMAEDLANEAEQNTLDRFDRGKFLAAIEETVRDGNLLLAIQSTLADKLREHAKI